MKNVLVTGAFGQLGTELRLLTENRPEFIFTDIREEGSVKALDICNAAAVEKFIAENDIGIIINCAAYTDVNKAESEEAVCRAINADGPGNLAKSAKRHGAALVHISTEYVFDGKRSEGGYTESDRRHPLSAYGRSKRDGEDRIRRIGCNSLIVRTSWLYSPFGKNFVKTMLRLGAEKEEIGVVCDQTGSPTYAFDLALALLRMCGEPITKKGEIYHFSNGGVCSWAGFATAIMKEAGLNCKVKHISTSEYPTPAVRPACSILDKSKIRKDYGIEIKDWKESLRDCLKRL